MCKKKSMTLEKVKAEAKKLGYKLIPIKKYVKVLPCPVCGKKRTSEWTIMNLSGKDTFRRVCHNCGFQGNLADRSSKTIEAWNDAVNEYNINAAICAVLKEESQNG